MKYDAQQHLHIPSTCTREEIARLFCKSSPRSVWLLPAHVHFDDCICFDSSLIALMVEWVGQAKQQGRCVHFSGCSSDVVTMLRAYGLWDILHEEGVLM